MIFIYLFQLKTSLCMIFFVDLHMISLSISHSFYIYYFYIIFLNILIFSQFPHFFIMLVNDFSINFIFQCYCNSCFQYKKLYFCQFIIILLWICLYHLSSFPFISLQYYTILYMLGCLSIFFHFFSFLFIQITLTFPAYLLVYSPSTFLTVAVSICTLFALCLHRLESRWLQQLPPSHAAHSYCPLTNSPSSSLSLLLSLGLSADVSLSVPSFLLTICHLCTD